MNKNRLFFILSAIALIFSLSCTRNVRPDFIKFKFIETSDIHGALFPFNFFDDTVSSNSLAQVYSFVKNERALPGQEVILLDNGDILQGDPTVYYYNFEKTNAPHICAEVMNFMKYDAATVGNHDIEPGHKVFDKINAEFNFPWLAANAIDIKTGKPYFKPYVILNLKGIKVVVLGMITPAIPKWLPEKIWHGIEFEDMLASAEKWVNLIDSKENPDILIGLFHSGPEYNYDGENENTYCNENASMLVARNIPGFDVVFVGHDHHGWNKKIINSAGEEVLLLGPTSRARDIAVANIQLSLDKTTNTYKKIINGKIIPMKGFEHDEEYIEKFSPVIEEIREYVSMPVGELTEDISSRNALFEDTPFVDLIHRIQLELTGADISFAAPLSFDTKLSKGKLYVRDMFKLYRFENLLYTMELTGREIKDYLEYSYDMWFNRMNSKIDNLLKFKTDENGKPSKSKHGNYYQLANAYYNFDSGAGIIYTVDVSKPEGKRIMIISMADGSPFVFDKKYKVAVNSYRGNGGGNHLTFGSGIKMDSLSGRIIRSTDKDLRFYMMNYIRENGVIDPETDNNWKVIPENFWKNGKEKDYFLLFGNKN